MWIMWCISPVKFSILINGTLVDFFESTRGVCQGDPLSPLLFDIVLDALSLMLDAAATLGHFSGFLAGNSAGTWLMVSHLLFANDTLIFCDAISHHLAALHGILARFEVISGIKINFLQSESVLIGNVLNMEELVEILGCQQSSLPLKYLRFL